MKVCLVEVGELVKFEGSRGRFPSTLKSLLRTFTLSLFYKIWINRGKSFSWNEVYLKKNTNGIIFTPYEIHETYEIV